MNKGTKILLGVLAAAGIGGGYLYAQKRKAAAMDETDPALLPDPSNTAPAPSGNKTTYQPAPAALDYKTPFGKSDKAHVQIMQKMIGVVPDGSWGPKTEAALPKNLKRPFSLDQLQAAINALKNSAAMKTNVHRTGLKIGDTVYAAFTTDVEVTKGAKYKDLKWTTTGAKRTQEVRKGQYLGKIVVLNPNSVLILNGFNELVLAPYSKLSKKQLSGFGRTDLL